VTAPTATAPPAVSGPLTDAGSSRPIRSPWAPWVIMLKYVALLALLMFFLLPVYALVITALKDPVDVSVTRMWDLPSSLSFARAGSSGHRDTGHPA
jgi:glucose/mannose transport system permease protein